MAKVTVRCDTYTRVPSAAIHDPRLSRGDYAVLCAICDGMNNTTNINSYATLASISKIARVNTNNASASMKHLEVCGYITRMPKAHKKAPNAFKVNFDISFEVTEDDPYYQDVENTYRYDHNAPLPTDRDVTSITLAGHKRQWKVSQSKCNSQDVSEKTQPKEEVIEAPIEAVKEETPVVLKPKKRTLKKVVKSTPVQKEDTPLSSHSTPTKKVNRPVFERGYNINTHTGTQPRPTAPTAPVKEEPPKQETFKRFDSGEECGPLHEENPGKYKLVQKFDDHGIVVDKWVVDKVTVLEDGCTELDHFFMKGL